MAVGGHKTATLELRKAYFSRLNGNVMLNGTAVKVYDRVFEKVSFPYIVIGAHTSIDMQSSKVDWSEEITITINIFAGFSSQQETKLIAEEIQGQVTELLTEDRGKWANLGSKYVLWNCKIDNLNTGVESFEGGTVNVYDVRIRNYIQQTEGVNHYELTVPFIECAGFAFLTLSQKTECILTHYTIAELVAGLNNNDELRQELLCEIMWNEYLGFAADGEAIDDEDLKNLLCSFLTYSI